MNDLIEDQVAQRSGADLGFEGEYHYLYADFVLGSVCQRTEQMASFSLFVRYRTVRLRGHAQGSAIEATLPGDANMDTPDQIKGNLARKYDAFAAKFSEVYLAGKERGRESMTVALEQAREQLTALGEFSTEQGHELKNFLARDLDQTIADAEHLGEEAKDRLNPARLAAGALSSIRSALAATEAALRSLGDKAREKLTYSTGEITSAGTLTCSACGQTLHLKVTGHVPPCPKCAKTVFTKSY